MKKALVFSLAIVVAAGFLSVFMPPALAADAEWSEQPGIVQAAAGGSHSLAVKSDGTLWAWGLNDDGQLGNGSTASSIVPVQVGTGTDWKSVAAGGSHSLAVKTDGTLWAWGLNSDGQLGNNSTASSIVLVRIGTGTDWASVAAGTSHSLAVKSDHTLWAWGLNSDGQLGNGSTASSIVPVRIGTGISWVSVAASGSHSIAIKNDGTVDTLWAWGLNNNGQLGDGSTIDSDVPVQVGINTDWASVAAGGSHSLAVKTNGTLWAWGLNDKGQLGNASTTSCGTPVQVGTDANWASVAVGGSHSLAVKTDDTLWAWGLNGSGQLGNNSTTNSNIPVQIWSMPPPVTYTLTYDGNGSTGGTAPTDSNSPYTDGTTVTVLGSGTLTRTDYTFAGWNTQADGLGTSYNAGGTFNISGNTTLYAKWTYNGTPVVNVTGVTLNKSSTQLTVGYTDTLTATVTPADATNKAVTWSSGNSSVATVSASGVVTAVSAGTTTIVVTTQDGSHTDICTVTVSPATVTYPVTVTGGTGGGSYAQGAIVNISANTAPAGYRFLNWTTASSGVTFVNANSTSTSFTMPPNTVAVTANYVLLTDTTNVTFTAIQVGGTSGTADSTGIRITFNQAVTGLAVGDITVKNSTGAVIMNTLSGSDTTYTLALSGVLAQGYVTVEIGNFGVFNVTTASVTVYVYKNTSSSSNGNVMYGDLSGNGSVDNSDLTYMLRYFTQQGLAIDKAAADVNGDGLLNNADLILLVRYFSQSGIVLGPQ